MAGEPLCSGTNNMLITMNSCYVALKVVSPAVAVAAAVYILDRGMCGYPSVESPAVCI